MSCDAKCDKARWTTRGISSGDGCKVLVWMVLFYHGGSRQVVWGSFVYFFNVFLFKEKWQYWYSVVCWNADFLLRYCTINKWKKILLRQMRNHWKRLFHDHVSWIWAQLHHKFHSVGRVKGMEQALHYHLQTVVSALWLSTKIFRVCGTCFVPSHIWGMNPQKMQVMVIKGKFYEYNTRLKNTFYLIHSQLPSCSSKFSKCSNNFNLDCPLLKRGKLLCWPAPRNPFKVKEDTIFISSQLYDPNLSQGSIEANNRAREGKLEKQQTTGGKKKSESAETAADGHKRGRRFQPGDKEVPSLTTWDLQIRCFGSFTFYLE